VALTDNNPAPTTAAAPQPVPGHVIYRRVVRERIAYATATAGIAVLPQIHSLWPAHLAAAATGVATAAYLIGKPDDDTDHLGLIKRAGKAMPFVTGAAAYLVNYAHPGTTWWELASAGAWGLLMAATAPFTRSAGFTLELPADLPALTSAQAAPPASYAEFLQRRWEASGAAPGTRLIDAQQIKPDRPDFNAVIVARTGRAVPRLSDTALAAAFDMPVGTVTLEPIDGSGPGRMRLTALPTLSADPTHGGLHPLQALWNRKVAAPGGAAPGMILLDHNATSNRISLRVTAPGNALINLPQKPLARAFGMKDADLVMVETDGLGDGVVSIYKTHPLIDIREATASDLTMDNDGRICLGLRHDGRAARIPLYDPAMGAITDLFAGAPGAGKSVTLNHLLAAERISGIVSIVADAQDGMSLPEADGRVYHFGKGIAATGATLAALNELGRYREKISAANGWGSFEIGNPWSLVNGTLDELNRILSAESTVPREFRKWVTGLVGDTQSTGRKLGLGLRFAAQSIHLADLGDKDKIRANAKNGTVWLGRVNSSTTQHMAADGVLPAGVVPEPIPRYFKTGNDIDAAFKGIDAAHGPITAGLANIIQGGTLFLARTFKAVKVDKTYPGIINLYESAPIPVLTPEEDRVFRQAYDYYLDFAEQLLSEEDADSDNESPADTDPYDNTPAPQRDNNDTKVADRILAVLANGPTALKEVRKHLPDVAPGTVNNVMGQLHTAGQVTNVSRGVYRLPE
jgi:hypothetical protein